MTNTNRPATTKIATCYNPEHEPGSRRLVEIRLDNRTGRCTAAEIHNGGASWSSEHSSEIEALAHAVELGYSDVVRA